MSSKVCVMRKSLLLCLLIAGVLLSASFTNAQDKPAPKSTDVSKGTEKMTRNGMIARLKPEARAEYLKRHANPWQGVLKSLRNAGYGNFSIFMRGDTLCAYHDLTEKPAIPEVLTPEEKKENEDWGKLHALTSFYDPKVERWDNMKEIFFMDNPKLPAGGTIKRTAMISHLRPEFAEQYKKNHANPWPAVIKDLRNAGIDRFSIFIEENTNTLFGYIETKEGVEIPKDPLTDEDKAKTKEWGEFADKALQPFNKENNSIWQPMESIFFMK